MKNERYILLFILSCVVIYTLSNRLFEGFELSITPSMIYHNVKDAYEGVAVGKDFFYAINTKSISKHKIDNGEHVKTVVFTNHPRIKHLNSGVVLGNRLYVCNNPDDVLFSYNTIEVFDLNLEFQYYIEVTGNTGSLIAIDYFDNRWWTCFSHYKDHARYTIIAEMYFPRPDLSTAGQTNEKDLVRWHIRNRYYFPNDIVNRSNAISGFSFGPDGLVYATGKDCNELFVLHLHRSSPIMSLDRIIKLDIDGQAIDWDRKRKKLYGIHRGLQKVIVFDGVF